MNTHDDGSNAPAVAVNGRFAGDPVFAAILKGERVLTAGDRGDAVKSLQQALMDMGFPMLILRGDVGVSGVDGVFGGQTTTALRNFQVHASHSRAVSPSGVLDAPTMKVLNELAPGAGQKAWDPEQPAHAPSPYFNDEAAIRLRILVVKDEHRTFLYDRIGKCVGIYSNAHGAAANATDDGLKRIRTKIDEPGAKATSRQLWGNDRSFGARILDLSWASGRSHGEELHGTYDYANMGRDVSHGCVRHYNEDIIAIFNAVAIDEFVAIVPTVTDPRLVQE